MKRFCNNLLWVGIALIALAATVSPVLALTPVGTPISNTATVDYQDANGNNLTKTSNTVTTTVSQVGVVDVSPDNSASADPGDTVPYLHVVTNNGNGPDTIDVTVSSSQGWTVNLYLDDGDSIFEPGAGDVALADSDADLIPDTGSLAATNSVQIWAAVDVPAGAADAAVDTTTVTGTSSFDTAVSNSATDTTTVTSPSLSVAKSVTPLGNQPPGTTLTYTIVVTNNGSAGASAVVLKDVVPANTTYVANSIVQDAASKTDIADPDNADWNVTAPNRVTVNIGVLAPTASTTISFQVTID